MDDQQSAAYAMRFHGVSAKAASELSTQLDRGVIEKVCRYAHEHERTPAWIVDTLKALRAGWKPPAWLKQKREARLTYVDPLAGEDRETVDTAALAAELAAVGKIRDSTASMFGRQGCQAPTESSTS